MDRLSKLIICVLVIAMLTAGMAPAFALDTVQVQATGG